MWWLMQLIYTGILGNDIGIDMPQYRGVVYDLWHYSLNVYAPERKGNKLALRLSGVQLIVERDIFVEIHKLIFVFAYFPLYI